MTWSSTGSATTYPTYQPTGLDPNLTVKLTFRLAPDVGIVYVTGFLQVGGSTPSVTSPVFTIPAAYRPPPQPAAQSTRPGGSLPTYTVLWTNGGGQSTSLDLNIGPNGDCIFGQTATPALTALYVLRGFYFTNVTPS